MLVLNSKSGAELFYWIKRFQHGLRVIMDLPLRQILCNEIVKLVRDKAKWIAGKEDEY